MFCRKCLLYVAKDQFFFINSMKPSPGPIYPDSLIYCICHVEPFLFFNHKNARLVIFKAAIKKTSLVFLRLPEKRTRLVIFKATRKEKTSLVIFKANIKKH